MANDILSLVSEPNRPYWCDVYALMKARQVGWETWTVALPIAIRVIEGGGFRCTPFEFVETVVGVMDRRLHMLRAEDETPAGTRRIGDDEVSRVLARLAGEVHAALRKHYPA